MLFSGILQHLFIMMGNVFSVSYIVISFIKLNIFFFIIIILFPNIKNLQKCQRNLLVEVSIYDWLMEMLHTLQNLTKKLPNLAAS